MTAKKTKPTKKPENTGSKQGKGHSATRGKDGRFLSSGNPAGRPKGSFNNSTLIAQQVIATDGKKITEKAVEMALEGNIEAIRIILTRLVPPVKDRPLNISLPDTSTISGLEMASDKILELVGNGELTASEAATLSTILRERRMAKESSDFEQRLKALEEKINK